MRLSTKILLAVIVLGLGALGILLPLQKRIMINNDFKAQVIDKMLAAERELDAPNPLENCGFTLTIDSGYKRTNYPGTKRYWTDDESDACIEKRDAKRSEYNSAVKALMTVEGCYDLVHDDYAYREKDEFIKQVCQQSIEDINRTGFSGRDWKIRF